MAGKSFEPMSPPVWREGGTQRRSYEYPCTPEPRHGVRLYMKSNSRASVSQSASISGDGRRGAPVLLKDGATAATPYTDRGVEIWRIYR